MTTQDGDLSTAVSVLKPRCAVHRGGGDKISVGAEGNSPHLGRMAAENAHLAMGKQSAVESLEARCSG